MKWILLFLFFLSTSLWGNDTALQKLMEGNARYVKGHVEHPTPHQRPFAVIVACSDSRVAPEIIFDQGLGDLFVVRVAGNVVGDLGKESILYAVQELKASLVMVLGHERCGAVDAVMHHKTKDIPEIAALIAPAIQKEKSLEKAIKANVKNVVKDLRTLLNVKVVGGYYDFETGKVEIL